MGEGGIWEEKVGQGLAREGCSGSTVWGAAFLQGRIYQSYGAHIASCILHSFLTHGAWQEVCVCVGEDRQFVATLIPIGNGPLPG